MREDGRGIYRSVFLSIQGRCFCRFLGFRDMLSRLCIVCVEPIYWFVDLNHELRFCCRVGFYFVDANKVPQGVVKRGIILAIQLILDYLQKCLELDTPHFVPLSSFYLIWMELDKVWSESTHHIQLWKDGEWAGSADVIWVHKTWLVMNEFRDDPEVQVIEGITKPCNWYCIKM
jgi:hypothetical protein